MVKRIILIEGVKVFLERHANRSATGGPGRTGAGM